MDDATRCLKLKEMAESLQRKADQAEGALKQLKAQLKQEHGVKSVEDAGKLLVKMEREEKELEKEFADGLKTFETEWKERLKQ